MHILIPLPPSSHQDAHFKEGESEKRDFSSALGGLWGWGWGAVLARCGRSPPSFRECPMVAEHPVPDPFSSAPPPTTRTARDISAPLVLAGVGVGVRRGAVIIAREGASLSTASKPAWARRSSTPNPGLLQCGRA